MAIDEGGARVLTLQGKPIDWTKPPKPTDRVMWSERDWQGDKVIGSLRSIAHLDRLDALAKGRGWKSGIVIIQPPYNTGVLASAGTHDYDACSDLYIPGASWWDQQRFLRANGFACWYRHPPKFGNHIHGFTLPPREGKSISDDFKVHGFKVGKYVDGGYSTYGRLVTSSQISDYYARAFGLSNMHTPGSDKSWHPATHLKGGVASTIFDLDAYIARRRKAAA